MYLLQRKEHCVYHRYPDSGIFPLWVISSGTCPQRLPVIIPLLKMAYLPIRRALNFNIEEENFVPAAAYHREESALERSRRRAQKENAERRRARLNTPALSPTTNRN